MEDLYNIISQFHFRNELWVLFIPLGLMAIDVLSGVIKAFGLLLPEAVMNGISFYIIFMEIMSILENADALGIPIPKFVKDVINNANDQLQNGQHKKDEED